MSQLLRILLASLSSFVVCNAAVASETVDLFERHVRPLFVDRCQKCHGDAKQWGSLRLDSLQGVLDGGDSGPAVVPGNAAVGELVTRLASPDDQVRMPPPEEGPPVSPDVVDAVRAWIAAGAVWPAGDAPVASPIAAARETHWAYQPISAAVPLGRVMRMRRRYCEVGPPARVRMRRPSYGVPEFSSSASDTML